MSAETIQPMVGTVWQHRTTGKLATVFSHFVNDDGRRLVSVRYVASGNRRTRWDMERTYFLRMYRLDKRELCPACGKPR